jgi:hypothetical protein
MFEDLLAYQPGSLQRFSELLAADLDDDAQQFYARMAADIGAVATSAGGRAVHPARVVQTLLEALVAAPAARAACWRRLYHQSSLLVAACARIESPALARLRGFLRENVDLAHPPPTEGLERMVLGRSAGA